MGRMHGIEGNIQEQRLTGIAFAQDAYSLAGDQFRAVTFLAQHAIIAVPIKSSVAKMGVVVDGSVVVSVLVDKPAASGQVLRRAVAQVPFADNGRFITRFAQGLRQRPFFQRQSVLGPWTHHSDLQAQPKRIPARHERGACR